MEQIGKPLQRKLASARNWWRVTRLVGGVAWAVAALIVVALICYHTDRLTSLSASAREYWRLGIGSAGLVVLLALWLAALLRRLPDTEIAADVERRYPALHERLLTTIELVPAMAVAGENSLQSSGFSRSMTDALAAETQREASGLDFRRAVNTRPMRAALMAALFTGGLLALHIALAPDAFANWVRRMENPRADVAPWANTRVWVQPQAEVLPRGAGVNVIVTTRGSAAEHATLRYRLSSDVNAAWKSVDLTHPVEVSNSEAPGAPKYHTMTANLPGENRTADAVPPRQFHVHVPSLSQSVVMYAVANDGRSNEKAVSVEDRPTLLNMRMTLHYPAYTHKPAQTMTVTGGSIAAPKGTEVEVLAGANKPLRSAELILDNQPSGFWTVQKEKAAGRLAIRKDASYALNLVDRHGFDNPGAPRYEIRALKDQAPTVQITRPTADIDLQPQGSLPLVARAVDDYGVSAMHLMYDSQHDTAMGGHRAGPHGGLQLPGPTGRPTADVAERWHVASVHPQVGDTLSYYVTATDNDTLDGPHMGRSAAFRVHILSLAEMQKRLAEQMAAEQAALGELRKQQIEAQNQLRTAQHKPDAQNVAKAQEAQRAVAQEAKSVAQRIADTSAQLENNSLATKSELARRDEAEKLVNDIAQQKAPAAAENVQKAQPKAGEAARRQHLAAADQQESAIKHDIENAAAKLSQAPPPAELAKELARLAKEQQDRGDMARQIAEEVNAEKKESPGKPMTAEAKAALEMERQHQAEVNRDTQRLQQQLQAAAKSAQERGQQKEANALNQAAKELAKGQVNQRQQAAQQNLNKNNPGEAAPQQDRAATALAKAAESAKEAADPNGDETAKQEADRLEKTAQDLHNLAEQQKNLANQTAQKPNGDKSQQLAGQQKNLENQTKDAQKNLSGAPQAQKSAQGAQQNQSKAGQQLSQNSPQSAKAPAQTAAQQLEQAAQQAQNAANQIRQQQAAQELADKVDRLAQIQRGVQHATQRLQNAQQQRGQLNDNERKELGQTGERQKGLEEQAKALAENTPSPAFQQALQTAAKQMHPASQNLNQSHPNTGEMTQTAQDRAGQTLETIAQALRGQAQNGPQKPQDAQQQQQQSAQQAEQMQQAAALGDLMLAQGLQKQIRQNTGKLDKQRANQQLNPGQQQEASQQAQGEQQVNDIVQGAQQALGQVPNLAQAIQQATQHIDQAGKQLAQQQTGQATQGHQDAALQNLDQAVKAAQQAMQQQQQQQQQQQAGNQPGQPMPMPAQQGNQPDKNAFTKLVTPKSNGLLSSDGKGGKGFGDLNARQQRVMRDGRNDPVPAEYRDLVKRYFGGKGAK